MAYTFGTTLSCSFNEAIERVTEKLKVEGFGILTRIDVSDTLKAKINKDMQPYTILGACNPPLAAEALDADISVGALLPCNVVVRQAEDGEVVVEFLDPNLFLTLSEFDGIHSIATEARSRLQRVLESL
ncbi:MAG: DUF302 domain-containing protein [Gammaproteobacteria bacterium]|jgi:uncharacterized protein (DUF302 family)|nr:DUF302 domain-containing protein [Gammaproteobacteria bacterium]MBT3490076.1 DUF302 domain-containing protein [Gammaproteobacteria bacterium]MBT3719498.1 DUF302 domain-containing protein [Gammaproteobacteria bacterium]MBT3844010.1 DUF302 domain-containing protein [Gammaproteobacteria bacterium]MBT3892957.1 DUF302 domain-containing protein [Gammaproteobacteria bacterium]